MKKEIALKISAQSQSNYDLIAKDWDQTRKNLWPEMNDFKIYLKPGDKILDAGCGNGRLVQAIADLKVEYWGIDNSSELIALAKKNFPDNNFSVADFAKTVFADNSFDVIFCLAALHHIPGQENRQKTLAEFNRLLKPNGYLLMLNWRHSSPNFSWLWLKYTLSKFLRKSELDLGDIFVPWKRAGIKRYVHLFFGPSLNALLKKNGFKIKRSFVSKPSPRGFKNLVSIAQKAE